MTLDILNLQYPVMVSRDTCTDGSFCYVAEHPDLPGCVAHGATLSEAKELLAHAKETYINYLLAKDYPVPMPSPSRALEWQNLGQGDMDELKSDWKSQGAVEEEDATVA